MELNSFNNQGEQIWKVSYMYDKFDSVGNWLRQVQKTVNFSSEDESPSVLYRIITYY
jgi:hypothetical protein